MITRAFSEYMSIQKWRKKPVCSILSDNIKEIFIFIFIFVFFIDDPFIIDTSWLSP